MNNILEIQKLHLQRDKLVASVNSSKENKLLEKFTNIMKEGRNFVNKISSSASEMIAEYNRLKEQYDSLRNKAEDITSKQKVEQSSVEDITSFIDSTSTLASDLAVMEQKIKEVSEKSTSLLNDYNLTMGQLKNTKQKVDALRQMVAKQEEDIQPQLKEIDEKVKELEKDADKESYELYKKMRKDNIFPVFVKLVGNRCGHCRMELPLSFVERLKEKGKLQCEECHSFIMFDEKNN